MQPNAFGLKNWQTFQDDLVALKCKPMRRKEGRVAPEAKFLLGNRKTEQNGLYE